MKKTCTVYGLASSEDRVIRYIGQTVRDPNKRLGDHLAKARSGERTHRGTWLRSVMTAGHSVYVVVLIENARWNTDEIELIAHLRSQGFNLVNGTTGGDGIADPTADVRRKMSAARLSWTYTDEQRRAMSERMKGKKLPASQRARMIEGVRRAYQERAEEIGAKLSAAKLGVPKSAATRAAIGRANSGKVRSPEMRQRWSQTHTDRYKDQAVRDKTSEATRAAMARPEVRERMLAGLQASLANPEHRAARQAGCKARWLRPAERAKAAMRRARFSEADVIEMRNMRRNGAQLQTIAERFGAAESSVSLIVRGKQFGHIPGAVTDIFKKAGV